LIPDLSKNRSIKNIWDITDQMFAILDKIQDYNTSKVTCIKYTVAAILHKDNYNIILSNLSNILVLHMQLRNDEKKTDKLEETNSILSFIIEFIIHAIEYNDRPTIQNFITILRSFEVEDNIIRRYEFIYSLSNNFLLPQLKLPKSQVEVLLDLMFKVAVLIYFIIFY
jgi:hypothetical protein